jgi:septal ring factor EnvC (AmiA/AmiB activator)
MLYLPLPFWHKKRTTQMDTKNKAVAPCGAVPDVSASSALQPMRTLRMRMRMRMRLQENHANFNSVAPKAPQQQQPPSPQEHLENAKEETRKSENEVRKLEKGLAEAQKKLAEAQKKLAEARKKADAAFLAEKRIYLEQAASFLRNFNWATTAEFSYCGACNTPSYEGLCPNKKCKYCPYNLYV